MLHSMPPPGPATPDTWRPRCGSSDGDQGTSWKPSPPSSIAKRPDASVNRRLKVPPTCSPGTTASTSFPVSTAMREVAASRSRAQRVEQPARENRSLPLVARHPLARQILGAGDERVIYLAAETRFGQIGRALADELAIEPRRARRGDLIGEREVGPDRQRGARLTLPVLEAAKFDDRARRGIARRLQPGEADMVRAPVDAVDHRVGRTGQLVVQATLDQATDDRRWLGFGVQRHVGAAIDAAARERSVHGGDDVTPDREIAQAFLDVGLERPLRGSDRLGEAHAFELGGAAEHDPSHLGIGVYGADGTEVGDAVALARRSNKRAVDAGEAIGIDIAGQRCLDLALGPVSELEVDERLDTATQALGQVIAAHDKVVAAIRNTAHEDMDVRVVGIPVIDRDPVELRPEIAFGLMHQLARGRAQVAQLGGILGRDDEAEMMPVVLAAVRETACIGGIAARVEHARGLARAADTVALEIGNVLGHCGRSETRAPLPDDTGLDDDPARARAQPRPDRGDTAPPEGRAAAPSRTLTTDMAGPLRGAKDLRGEALGRASALAADAARSRPEILTASGHWLRRKRVVPSFVAGRRVIAVCAAPGRIPGAAENDASPNAKTHVVPSLSSCPPEPLNPTDRCTQREIKPERDIVRLDVGGEVIGAARRTEGWRTIASRSCRPVSFAR